MRNLPTSLPPAHRQQHHPAALSRSLRHQPAGSAQVLRLHARHLQLDHSHTELWQQQTVSVFLESNSTQHQLYVHII